MNWYLKRDVVPLLLCTIVMILFEIFSTAFMPLLGIENYRIPFHILVVLYLGFKLETPLLAVYIFSIQFVHSFFTIEGWEMGTIAGIITCTTISYLRDLIHLSSGALTMLMTQVFQILWFVIISIFLFIKLDSSAYIVNKFWRFIPESLFLSLLAPVVFSVFDRLWKGGENSAIGDNV
ncbi:MAG: hypothetical protein ACPGJV_02780 [Bacteriovoracaceae bacterium]